MQPAWRELLQQMRVTLVCYVPDDAFVARLKRVSIRELKALDFVHWVEGYGLENKMDSVLRHGQAPRDDQTDFLVSVLMVPDADPAALRAVQGQLRKVFQKAPHRLGTILRGTVPAARLEVLARSEAVLWVEPMARMKLFDEVAAKIVAGDAGPNQTLAMSLGLDGGGVTVAVADSGLDNGEPDSVHPDLAGRVIAFLHYGTNLTDAADEHGHGTHVTGIIAGNGAAGETDETGALYGLGVAPGAQIVVQRIFDGLGGYEPPPTFETLTRHAYQAGAEIGSNSWGDDSHGQYDTFAAEFDALVRDADATAPGDQQYILEFSAGNAGPGARSIGTPAVAKNVIATGASQNNRFDLFVYDEGEDAMADFSSRGPAADGRIKPDLVAPGTWIASLQSAAATDENAWLPISDLYQYQSGTSQAGPHLSGAAAVFVQFYRWFHDDATPSPALVKAALINSATDLADSLGTEPVPNYDEGWGRVDLSNLFSSTRSFEFIDQTNLLTTGGSYGKYLVVPGSEEPLKITMAYTDVPGFPGAIPALVNDLDLEVERLFGPVYRGNQFLDGNSVENALASDNLNNVEAVHLAAPPPGVYRVRVHARNVVQDSRSDTPGVVDQDFALVVSGTVLPASQSMVLLDRGAYRAPDRIRVILASPNLDSRSTVQVTVRSSSESPGEVLTLSYMETGNPFSLFTGMVATALSPVVADGQLQIAHGDTIEVLYQDIAPPTTLTATARADLIPPLLSQVTPLEVFGRTVITWQTDEPANSIVRYGIDPDNLEQRVTNTTLTTMHEVTLRNLASGSNYWFLVTSSDEAGNVRTDDNQGNLYPFVALTPPSVLLVDSYTDELFGFPIPPLSEYTDALDATGFTYNTWDATPAGQGRSPTWEELEPYDAVIWRVQEFEFFSSPFSAAAQVALTNYLARGGSLLLASMEALSRLDEGGYPEFGTNVLHVLSYSVDDQVPNITGAQNERMTAGMNIHLNYTNYFDEYWKPALEMEQDVSDSIVPGPGAAPILVEPYSGKVVGLRFPSVGEDSPGRVVFLSFPLDAVPMDDPAPNNRVELLRNLLQFLAPPPGVAVLALDNTQYTIPSQVIVELTDTDRTGQGQTTVQFTSKTDLVGKTVPLTETARPGLFRGFITLVPANSSHPTELWVTPGDWIRAEYLDDAFAGAVVSMSATVETDPPEISNVSLEPYFIEALVTWSTSESADALVQFGESAFLGRTAYRSSLSKNHELMLTGLQPSRLYYFQVVSRDNAGNATVDDNQGQYYTFSTLTPLSAPWTDDMEQGEGDWDVVDTELTEVGWQRGMPQNSQGITAHSPVNAWGSNLRGDPISLAESWLFSPLVFLSDGNRATLRFFQNHDFLDVEEDPINLEAGQVLLFTANATEPVELLTVTNSSLGWVETEIDLTPYLGQLVYIAWYYLAFSWDYYPRMGWLVDDVSITVSGGSDAGQIVITNNLAQATWVLDGPNCHTNRGICVVLAAAPPGQYTITYQPVPFYQTPQTQSASLAARATVTFHGNYTFMDQNTNGMSDAWEQQVFGEISASRTAQTDTDNDGLTDRAEFIAGTDPNTAASLLEMAHPVRLPGGGIRLDWTGVADHIYRVEGSTDGTTWTPVSDWIPATGSALSFDLPATTLGAPFLFRVEVRP